MNNFIDSLSVVIVLYNIRLEESISFQSILAAKKGEAELCIYIYDNSLSAQEIKHFHGLQIFYKHNPMNPGVSKAYNAGAEHAKSAKKEWILVLDQDTTLPIDILSSYWQAVQRHPTLKLFVPTLKLSDGRLFSPCKYRFKRGFHLKQLGVGIHSLKEVAPVNSGMLINIEAFFKAGGYNNAVKLDFSDFQFIERFRKIHSEFCVINVDCEQDFSDDEASVTGQLNRFKYYCEGALNITKDGFWDWMQYYVIVFLRALSLTIRHKRKDFLLVYVNSFVSKSFSISS